MTQYPQAKINQKCTASDYPQQPIFLLVVSEDEVLIIGSNDVNLG
jgi:hypothetical protein